MHLDVMLHIVVDEPTPARAFDARGFLVEYLDHHFYGAILMDNGIVERARAGQLAVSLWAHRIPEDFVVEVTTSVEADVGGDLIQCSDILPL